MTINPTDPHPPGSVPPGLKLGERWECPHCGGRHFVCPLCQDVCAYEAGEEDLAALESMAVWGKVPDEPDRCYVCEDCYPKALEMARVAGLI